MKNFKRIIKFSKPKSGPFTVSSGCYLTVLSAKPQMPSLLELVNPKGEGGAVVGLGVPLAAGAGRTDLARPMARGAYALSTTDKKTVLKLYVMPREEAGFDPIAFVRSEAASTIAKEILVRIESTWLLGQLTFESYDPEGYPAMDFFLGVAKRLAELTDGVVADPVCQTYRLPENLLAARPPQARIMAHEHVEVKVRPLEAGLHLYTLGLSKFDHPEVEMYGLSPTSQEGAVRFLYGLAQAVLDGSKLEVGAEVGAKELPLKVAPGGLEKAVWGEKSCFELIPAQSGRLEEPISAWLATLQ